MAEPWIRVVSHLSRRKVAQKLAPLCRGDRQKAAGVLVDFWSGVSEFAQNGFVHDVDDDTIEDWANWKGRRGLFAQWVREQHMDEEGRVPHWDEYQGALETRKEKDRQRKQRQRVRGTSDGSHADSPAEVTRNVTRTVRGTSAPTRGDGTVRNGTNTPPTADAVGSPSSSSAELTGRGDLMLRLSASRQRGLQACLAMWERGEDLPAGVGIPTAEQIDQACREAMASVDVAQISARVLRAYVVHIVRGEEAPVGSGFAGRGPSFGDVLRAEIEKGGAL